MKCRLPFAMFLASALILGCNAETVAQINAASVQARTGPAVRLATSATIAQMALFHLAAAVSQAVSKDLGDSTATPMAPSSGPESEFTYEVDRDAGTGRIIRMHEGKRAVDLSFTFEGEGTNGGVAYAITRTSGHFEGYQLLLPRMTLLYSPILGEGFSPLRHEDGSILINVTISANGYFGVSGVETMRLSKADLSLIYPISEREVRVGVISAVGRDGSTFEGEVSLVNRSIKLKGTLKDSNGALLYDLSTAPNGEVSLMAPVSSNEPSNFSTGTSQ